MALCYTGYLTNHRQHKTTSIEQQLTALLAGIDHNDCDHTDGWWETNEGAEFGAAKLAKAREIAREADAEISRLRAALAACDDKAGSCGGTGRIF